MSTSQASDSQQPTTVDGQDVLALDPGLATGVATLNNGVYWGTQLKFEEVGPFVENYLRLRPGAQVVCENFFITSQTAKKTPAPWSLKLIGVAEYLCQKYGNKFTLQAPADAKRLATDPRLKALDWYSGGEGHQDDASRHLLIYCLKNGIIDGKDLVDL